MGSPPEQGANCWGGMAMDEQRGIAYVTTGSPKPDFLGWAIAAKICLPIA